MAFGQGGEFYWDTGVPIHLQGFNVEPTKGTMEAGEKCTLTITWTPQSGYKVRKTPVIKLVPYFLQKTEHKSMNDN